MLKERGQDYLMCYADCPLSTFNQNFFTKCYQPILSNEAYTLYLSFYSLIKVGLLESDKITYDKLLRKINFSSLDKLVDARKELEALGLIKTYLKKSKKDNDQLTTSLYIIVLNVLPTPYLFFNSDILNSMLKEKIDQESYDNLIKEYLVHTYDLKKIENISKTMDDLYVNTTNNPLATTLWQSNLARIEIKGKNFDYDYVTIMLSDKTNLSLDYIKSIGFYEIINRLVWVYDLDENTLIKVLTLSVVNDQIDFDLVKKQIKKILDSELHFTLVENKEEKSANEEITILNTISPKELVANKYHTNLTFGELEMFDKLLVNTNIPKGVLNILIIYVLDTKNGEIPSYNYFLKVINTWIRKGVKTTQDAYNLINQSATPNNKKAKPVTSWYQDYIDKNVNNKKNKIEATSSLQELEEFFNQ